MKVKIPYMSLTIFTKPENDTKMENDLKKTFY